MSFFAIKRPGVFPGRSQAGRRFQGEVGLEVPKVLGDLRHDLPLLVPTGDFRGLNTVVAKVKRHGLSHRHRHPWRCWTGGRDVYTTWSHLQVGVAEAWNF